MYPEIMDQKLILVDLVDTLAGIQIERFFDGFSKSWLLCKIAIRLLYPYDKDLIYQLT